MSDEPKEIPPEQELDIAPESWELVPDDTARKNALQTRKRTKQQYEEDIMTVSVLMSEKKQTEIRDFINARRPYQITREQVSKDIQEVYRRLKEKHFTPLPLAKAKELEYIEHLERILLKEFHESGEDAISQKSEKVTGKDGGAAGGVKTTVTREKRRKDLTPFGYLLALQAARIRIRGLEEPTKIEAELTNKVEDSSYMVTWRENYKKRLQIEIEREVMAKIANAKPVIEIGPSPEPPNPPQ